MDLHQEDTCASDNGRQCTDFELAEAKDAEQPGKERLMRPEEL